MFSLRALFKKEADTVLNGAIMIGGISIISKILGLFRDRILASEFGASSSLDIYYAAFRIPAFIYDLFVLGALSATFIPIFQKCCFVGDYKQKEKNVSAWHFVNIIINTLLFVLIILIFILIPFIKDIMMFITPGFTPDQLEATVSLTQIMLLSPIFLGLSGIFGGVLQSFKNFFIYSIAPVMYNIGIIIGALFFVKPFGLNGLAMGVVLGSILHFGMQLIGVKSFGFAYRFVFDFKDKNLIEMFKLMGPRMLTLGTIQLSFLLTTFIASTLAQGSLTVFNLANNLQSLPVSVFGISLAIAVFPSLVDSAVKQKINIFIKSLKQTFVNILFFTIPATILIFVLRAQIVRMVLGAGSFDWEATIRTIDALSFFCISIFAQSLIQLLIRAFYAMKETLIPFLLGFISVFINLMLSLYLGVELGVSGLALSFAISSVIYLLLLIIVFEMRYSLSIIDYGLCRLTARILFAGFLLGVVTQGVKYIIGSMFIINTLLGIVIQIGVASTLGLSIYFIVTYWMNFQESETIFASTKNLLSKKQFRTISVPNEKIGD